MLGLNKSQLQHEISFRVSSGKPVLPEFKDLRQLADQIIEGVAYAIAKNNEEIERKLRDSGIKL